MKPVKLISTIAFLLSFYLAQGAVQADRRRELGNPLITNYTTKQFQEEAQIWNIVQDRRGVLYFGTRYNVVEFDGHHWTHIPVKTRTVRGLTVDTDGTIYAGMMNDLGYLASNRDGQMKFRSMLDKVAPEHHGFGDVWSAHSTTHGVYFTTRYKILHFINDTFEVIKASLYKTYDAHDKLYLLGFDKGFALLDQGKQHPLPYFKNLSRKSDLGRVVVMPWHSGKTLIVTSKAGAFLHDLEGFLKTADKSSFPENESPFTVPFVTEVDAYLLANPVYCGVKISDERYALGTLGGGVVIIDDQGKLVRIINRNRGLQDDLVISFLVDAHRNLWVGTNNGISHVLLNSPVSRFDMKNGIESISLWALRHNETLYLSTFTGIYYIPPYKPNIEDDIHKVGHVEGTDGQSFALIENQGALLGTHQNEVVQILDNRAHVLDTLNNTAVSFAQSKRFPNVVFVGTVSGMVALKISLTGTPGDSRGTPVSDKVGRVRTKRVDSAFLSDLQGNFYRIVTDDRGDLWASTKTNGLFHIRWTGDQFSAVQVVHYGAEDGLPQNTDNVASITDGKLIICTKKGFYELASSPLGEDKPKRARFVPKTRFGNLRFSDSRNFMEIQMDQHQNVWIANRSHLGMLSDMGDGTCTWETNRFRDIAGALSFFYVDDDDTIWVGTDEGVYRYAQRDTTAAESTFNALIRSVKISNNRVIHHGTYFDPLTEQDGHFRGISLVQPKIAEPVLPYEDNEIAFTYAATSFLHPEQTLFNYKLAGFDREWSGWTKARRREHTNLPHGKYRFLVKAKNAFGQESELASFKFSITPPWYRTIWAYLGYFIAGLLVFAGALRIITWRLVVAKKKLQKIVQERTREVVQQKEEIATQKDEIEQANKALWGEMHIAKKIQTTLLPETTELPGFDIAAYMEPADEVGGDYYDVVSIDDTNWLVIGDVSGHGVPAGLIMMMVRTSIRTALTENPGASPIRIFEVVNSVIYESIRRLGEEKYMTMTILSYSGQGKFYFSGLHQDIAVYRSATGELETIDTEGIWLGIMDDIGGMLELGEVSLEAGDTMLLYTDGIVESFDSERKMYSVKKLNGLFKAVGDQPVGEIKQTILESLKGYHCHDDVTFMVVKRVGP